MIPLFKVFKSPNVGKIVQEVWDSGMITEGKYSDEFEFKLGRFLNNHYTVLVNSGTSALTLAYHLIGLGPGDEVITSPMTCAATNQPILQSGAKIIWADIDPNTGNICPDSVASLITEKTKAIVGVHWGGIPFSTKEIRKRVGNDIWIVEDAAHALGSAIDGRRVGDVDRKTIACFSFQAIKHLTTGDGGAIAVGSEELAERARKLRWFGLSRKFTGSKWSQDIPEAGYKLHMNNMNAAIGIDQLGTIYDRLVEYGHVFRTYDRFINNPKIEKPKVPEGAEPSFWLYTVQVDDPQNLKEYLAEKHIASDVVHVRNDQYTCFNEFKDSNPNLPGVDSFDKRHLCIPIGWWLSPEDVLYIVAALNSY